MRYDLYPASMNSIPEAGRGTLNAKGTPDAHIAILGLLAGVVLAFVIEYFAPSADAAMARPIT